MTRCERGLTRRQFGAGVAALVASAAAGKATGEVMMPVIDTHAHVFHRGLKLAPGRRYAPDYDAPLSLYLEQLDHNGMSNGVLVQPSFLGTDNSYLVDCLKQTAGRLRGIAVVDPAVSADELRTLDKAGIVGIRLNLVGQPLPDLAASEWRGLLANVKAMGWQVEIQRNASDLAVLTPLLLDLGVTVVLDHFALPDPKLGVADPGFQSVLKLGATREGDTTGSSVIAFTASTELNRLNKRRIVPSWRSISHTRSTSCAVVSAVRTRAARRDPNKGPSRRSSSRS